MTLTHMFTLCLHTLDTHHNVQLSCRNLDSLKHNTWPICLTLSPPIPLRLYTLRYWSNPPFLIFDIRALWCWGLENGGLDQYGTEPFEQQQFAAAGIEGVKVLQTSDPSDITTSKMSRECVHPRGNVVQSLTKTTMSYCTHPPNEGSGDLTHYSALLAVTGGGSIGTAAFSAHIYFLTY